MSVFDTLETEQLMTLYKEERARYDAFKAEGLSLDLTRGKPSLAQLKMITSLGMDTALTDDDYLADDGSDIRNYGHLNGLPEARRFFGELLDVPAAQVAVLNNSSLSLMYDFFVRAMLYTLPGASMPWSKHEKVKVLCPSPGYDRHFAIAESLGLELVSVPMTSDGPDMDVVEALVADHSVKAMFTVPMYANPDGSIYSDEVCERLAKMEAAADFRVIWDNAYFLHHLDWDKPATIKEPLALAKEMGNPNRFVVFASMSKITYAGSGLAAIAMSEEDFLWMNKGLGFQTIGPDKMSQRRHMKFFMENGGIEPIMRRHAAFLKPKFDIVLDILDEELGGTGLATWTRPTGGYFISLDLNDGQAKAVVLKAKGAGVALTPAGSTYPYKLDPEDKNIRLAPTYPSQQDLRKAMSVLVNCVKLNALECALAKH